MLVLYGGTGFIGRHICEMADAVNCSTSVISRCPDRKFLKEFTPSISAFKVGSPGANAALKAATTVVYLAHNSKPATDFQNLSDLVGLDLLTLTNFTEKLLKVKPRCHLVYISSGGQIYREKSQSPIQETEIVSPTTPYGLSKSLNESVLNYFQQNTGLPVTILRLANPVGRWQVGTRHGFVSAAVRAATEGLPLTIFGEGKNARDYFDVDDFAKFICETHIQNNFIAGLYNIGTGVGLTERNVVDTVNNVLDCNLEIIFEPSREFDLAYAVLNISKAMKELGWNPKTPLGGSIAKIAQRMKK